MSKLETVPLLDRLVRFDSVSRNSNVPLADFICDYLDRPGVVIERNYDESGTKLNTLITYGELTPERAGLLLSGHMDVVPADEPEWTSDPFELVHRDNRLCGRGTSDMKGFLAVAMNAFRALTDRPVHPLALLFTYDEEVGTLGARRFVETMAADTLPYRAIIGEPTELRVVRMHKGHVKLAIEFQGRSAHSGYPHLGRSAIEPAGRAITALAEVRRQLETETSEYSEHFPDVPFVPLNIGVVRGGSAINVVPDRCRLELGFRPLPGTDPGDIVQRLRDALNRVFSNDDYRLEILSESPPMVTGTDSDLHEFLSVDAGQTSTPSVSFSTDAGWFKTVDIECVIWGPGSIEVAHRPNEYVPPNHLTEAATVLDRAVDRFCNE